MHRYATWDCRWGGTADRNADIKLLGGKIIAYKIRWFAGHWSGWYVPGNNDMDGKTWNDIRTCFGQKVVMWTIRYMWSYFEDHEHMFILCPS